MNERAARGRRALPATGLPPWAGGPRRVHLHQPRACSSACHAHRRVWKRTQPWLPISMHALSTLVHRAALHPRPQPTQIPSLTATTAHLVFQSHPRSPKYIQIRSRECPSPRRSACFQGWRRNLPRPLQGPGPGWAGGFLKRSEFAVPGRGVSVLRTCWRGSCQRQWGRKPAGAGWPSQELGALVLGHPEPEPRTPWGPHHSTQFSLAGPQGHSTQGSQPGTLCWTLGS